jgi:hypothetical protein
MIATASTLDTPGPPQRNSTRTSAAAKTSKAAGGAANKKQAAYMQSLGYAFLIKQLFPAESQTQ